MKPKYNIGDEVWLARWDQQTVYVTCPECGGTKAMRLLLWDGTEHTIACEGCKHGWDGPSGRVSHYERQPTAELCTIIGVEIQQYHEPARVEYRLQGLHTWSVEENRVCRTKEEAMQIAETTCREENETERHRVMRKIKDHRSWSWHAHYHRRAIREAQKQLDYHTAALDFAKTKAKEATAA
jgi:hypothetical protein